VALRVGLRYPQFCKIYVNHIITSGLKSDVIVEFSAPFPNKDAVISCARHHCRRLLWR